MTGRQADELLPVLVLMTEDDQTAVRHILLQVASLGLTGEVSSDCIAVQSERLQHWKGALRCPICMKAPTLLSTIQAQDIRHPKSWHCSQVSDL